MMKRSGPEVHGLQMNSQGVCGSADLRHPDGAVHPRGLPVRPRMTGFRRQPMPDAMGFADHVKAHWSQADLVAVAEPGGGDCDRAWAGSVKWRRLHASGHVGLLSCRARAFCNRPVQDVLPARL